MSFNRFGLLPEVVRGTQAMGFVEPTPIQLRAFPIVLAGKDLIGTAQTGTGKTAAFALPILTLLAKHGGFRCLVLEPTRELAAQVETAFRDYGRFTDLRVALVHGGVGYGKQREELKRGVDVLVATPGRLLDLLEQRTMSLKEIKILVLDEVDRMLDMGFLPDVRRIVEKIPRERQTLLFSATLPPEIERLAAWVLRDPELVEIGVRRSPAETVTHAVYPVAAEQKFDLLMVLLERTNFDSALIFCRTKYGADRIAHQLKQGKHAVAVLHSNRTQRERVANILRTAGAPNPMHIILRMLRHIIVDHVTYTCDVEPARCDIGRDHDFVFAALKSLERLDPFPLRPIGMQHGHRVFTLL